MADEQQDTTEEQNVQETPEQEQPEAKGFSQEDVDRIVKQRLERERARYADYDDLQKAAKELQKLRDAELSEVERRDKRIAELEQKIQDAEAAATARELEINERLIRAEVRAAAAKLGFVNPEDAYGLADLADVTVQEDSTVEGIDKALKNLAKDKPYLLSGDGQGGVGTPSRDRKKVGAGPLETEPARPIVRW